jgi:Aldehyde oxidase and xanthine dehydrogenase, a/b hammerhead domain
MAVAQVAEVTPAIVKPETPTPEQDSAVIGTRPIRPDGAGKVIGRALYGIDTQLPRMLHARVLRSPHAHARIKAIDASRALALPGVKAVVTAAELPQPSGKVADLGEGAMINPRFMSNNILAADKVLYKGHLVRAATWRINLCSKLAMWRRDSVKQMSPWNANTARPRCIRVISSPTVPQQFGTPMAKGPFGAAARGILRSATKPPWSWGFQCPESKSIPWRSVVASVARR